LIGNIKAVCGVNLAYCFLDVFYGLGFTIQVQHSIDSKEFQGSTRLYARTDEIKR
jgi:hypothetical protein